MKCPICGSTKLRIEVSFAGQVACKFVEGNNIELIENVALDSNWDDQSCCECVNCCWVGTVQNSRDGRTGEFKARASPQENSTFSNPMTSKELQELKRLLESQSCPSLWREQIERLISEVERLNVFLEMISRLTNSTQETGIASSSDTVVG